MGTSVANKAVQKWSQKDAEKAAAKGLAPSKFDDVLGKVGGYAGLASSFIPTNALGAVGMLGKAGKAAGTASKFQGALKTGLSAAGNLGVTGYDDPDKQQYGSEGSIPEIGSRQFGGNYGPPQGASNKKSSFIDKLGGIKGIAGIGAGVGGALLTKKLLDDRSERKEAETNAPQDYNPNPEPREVGVDDPGVSRFQGRMRRELGPVMGQSNQNNPNLAMSIGQGKMDAMQDQPFRGGYDVRTLSDYDENDDPVFEYTPMPPIGGSRRRRQQAYQ
jgi:hypothetical protein